MELDLCFVCIIFILFKIFTIWIVIKIRNLRELILGIHIRHIIEWIESFRVWPIKSWHLFIEWFSWRLLFYIYGTFDQVIVDIDEFSLFIDTWTRMFKCFSLSLLVNKVHQVVMECLNSCHLAQSLCSIFKCFQIDLWYSSNIILIFHVHEWVSLTHLWISVKDCFTFYMLVGTLSCHWHLRIVMCSYSLFISEEFWSIVKFHFHQLWRKVFFRFRVFKEGWIILIYNSLLECFSNVLFRQLSHSSDWWKAVINTFRAQSSWLNLFSDNVQLNCICNFSFLSKINILSHWIMNVVEQWSVLSWNWPWILYILFPLIKMSLSWYCSEHALVSPLSFVTNTNSFLLLLLSCSPIFNQYLKCISFLLL